MIKKVNEIISPVYLVGGCVRDELLGKEPKDYDFSTPLLPDEIEEKIKQAGRRVYCVGKKFGTLGFKVQLPNKEWEYVEVTTFRAETYTNGSRKPEVTFETDLLKDLSRRDFTINAIAKDIEGNYIDPFGGRLDLMKKKIICVTNATLRFKEDPLRILRSARFAAQLNFEIDQDLEKRATKLARTILNISRERWVMELDKILMSDNSDIGLDFLMRTRLMNFMFPEIECQLEYDQNSPYHDFTLWEHTKKVIKNAPKDINLKWAALLHDAGKPAMRYQKPRKDYPNYTFHERISAEYVLKIGWYLKWSNDRTKKVYDLVKYHLLPESPLKEADDKSKKEIIWKKKQ